jgi:vancomycin resistance protein YoaR
VVFMPAHISFAKTVNFNNQKWDLPLTLTDQVSRVFVRNDFNLADQAEYFLTGTEQNQPIQFLDPDAVATIEQIATQLNQKVEEPKLVMADNKATDFNPGQNGQIVDTYLLSNLLATNSDNVNLPVVTTQPDTSLGQTNSLGIKELVATGTSDFSGSTKNRIHNIDVGADKFNGVIVAQGQEFSFNDNLGPVDGEHGFLPELVIKATGVAPEFGGGLCQVSTTTFRAAMNAGLPITARRNHSFAVHYYSPQGTDATIYPGSADLKFINNLPSSLLIRTRINGNQLYFDFYGTKDSRQVTFEGPIVYDRKSDGSMKATWTRHVTTNGQTTTQVFNSNYLSPSLFEPAPKPATTPTATAATTPTKPAGGFSPTT